MMLGSLMFDAALLLDTTRSFSVAVDKDSQILVRLVETEAAIEFEILGSAAKAPSVAIDKRGNGRIDATEDFVVASSPDDADCFSRLLNKDSTSTCEPMPGGIVRTTLRRDGQLMTRFHISKSTISIDRQQIGFVVSVWDTKAKQTGCNNLVLRPPRG